MFKKAILLAFLYPAIAYSEPASLNKLFEVSQNNFCYQQNKSTFTSIEKYFNITDKTNLGIANQAILSMQLSQPIIEINETGDHLKELLYKNNNKKFPLIDMRNTEVKNIYTLEFGATMEVGVKPVQLINILAKQFPGLSFDTNTYAGSFRLVAGEKPDFDKSKNIKEFNQFLEKVPSSSFAFSIASSGGNSLLNYKCQVVILTKESPEDIAKQLVK